MYKNNKVAVIVPAAGKATRMGADINKQYIEISGIPVLARTLSIFENNSYIDQIVLLVNGNDVEYCRETIVEKYNFSKVRKIIPGGGERQETCRKGMEALTPDVDFVMIHDGARPFVTDDIIENALESVSKYGACCVCVPVKDTIKTVDSELNIVNTPERASMYAAQTPQGFRFNILKEIYYKAESEKYTATDDAQIAERYGYTVRVVKGSYENIKITTKEDLYIAENILKSRR